jgi:hypothetical protein
MGEGVFVKNAIRHLFTDGGSTINITSSLYNYLERHVKIMQPNIISYLAILSVGCLI